MSATLKWRPVGGGKALSDEVMRALRRVYGTPVDRTLRGEDVVRLETVAALLEGKAADEIAALIDAIQKHGAIELTETP